MDSRVSPFPGRRVAAPFHTRHPELVSGSIAPHDGSGEWQNNGAVGSSPPGSSREEEWILKQVQDDGLGLGYQAAMGFQLGLGYGAPAWRP
jgi:hypothetical protein